MRRKKGFGYYLYAIVTLVLFIAIIILSFLLLFHVQKIKVSGTNYSSEYQIINWIQEDPYTENSLYAFLKIKSGTAELPIYLEDVDVSLGFPWELRVDVTEKQMVGCIAEAGGYTYFDEEGLVLKKSVDALDGIPMIEGLDVRGTELYQTIPIENENVFSYIVQLSSVLQKRELAPDRVIWEKNSMNAYFGEVCVQFGKSGYEEKALQLSAIMEHLEGKNGILDLEHYDGAGDSISFAEKKTEK